jgi:hypothetical protein
VDDDRGIMCGPVPIAYELQACFGVGEEWLILEVCGTAAAAERADVCRRDAWGRNPIETRVVPVHALAGRS